MAMATGADYIHQLQKHVKTGQPVLKEQMRYVDAAEFWKDQYDAIYREKKGLQDKVQCLEEANRLLREKLRRLESSSVEGRNTVESSSSVAEGLHGVQRSDAGISRKRAAPSQEVEARHGQEDQFLSLIESDDRLRLSGYALRILRQRGQLLAATQECSTLDQINTLTRQILRTVNLLEESLSDCCLPLKSLRFDCRGSQTSFLLRQVFHQISLSFIFCFNAVNELFLTIPGRSKKPEVIYGIVMLFKKALDFLHAISSLQAQDEVTQRSQNMGSKRARTETTEYAVNKHLAQMLVSMVQDVDWKPNQTGHAEIIEGIVFSILEHTGRLVSDSVFGEHVATSDNPGNITKCPGLPANGVLRPESRYMVQVLYGVLGGQGRIELVSRMLSPGQTQSCGIGIVSASSEAMLSKSKKLLQSTLLKSILGGAKLESLGLPRLPPESFNLTVEPAVVENYGKEWLLETVWGLVGWDMVT
ncbi:hypothetical protein LZ554_004365 [Drepanopeziza brunnea f. sp. 'monogermtubi']|nr:hypothetical protein LZ554_004365 [Drepanopeziza brunnea f. sp. 'monogermtubi']